MRFLWPIARVAFCPLTILFIYLTVTEPSGVKQEQSILRPNSEGPQDTQGRDKRLNPFNNLPITDWSEKTSD